MSMATQIIFLEEQIKNQGIAHEMMVNQVRNALVEFEDGEYDEAIETLKGVVGDE